MPKKKKLSETQLKRLASVRLAKAAKRNPKSTPAQKKYADIVLKGGKNSLLLAGLSSGTGAQDTILKMDKKQLASSLPKPKPKPKPKKSAPKKSRAKVDMTPGKVRPKRKSKSKLVIKPAKLKKKKKSKK